jgi:vacuolar-type H+-ATPase subunit E/Vma4
MHFIYSCDSSGGVVLSTPDGKIICANTLDARLAMAFENRLPEIRMLLYGASLTRVHKD